MIIEKASADDLRRVAVIYTDNWKETYCSLLDRDFLAAMSYDASTRKWLDYFEQPGNVIIVARSTHGAVIGFAACSPYREAADTLYLDSLHVASGDRGTGIGSAILRQCGRYACENAFRQMLVDTVSGNDNAKQFYLHHGAVHFRDFTRAFGNKEQQMEMFIWKDTSVFK